MKIVAVVGQKGGVGKTTTAVSLAAVTAESSQSKVLLVDTDPQQSANWWAGQGNDDLPFDTTNGTDPKVLAELKKRAGGYDAVFVDTPGSLQDEKVLGAVLDNSDYVILPSNPAALSIRPLLETIHRLIQPRGIPYRVLLNRVDPRATNDITSMKAILDGQHVPYFNAHVREYKTHERAPITGLVVTRYGTDPSSRKAVDDYQRVALELFADWARADDPDNKASKPLRAVGGR